MDTTGLIHREWKMLMCMSSMHGDVHHGHSIQRLLMNLEQVSSFDPVKLSNSGLTRELSV